MAELFPFISVVIPTSAHRTNFLKRAVDSVLRQTFSSYEIVIVFDGDQNAMADFISHYSEKHIETFYLPPDGSALFVCEKRNYGVKKSHENSKWIIFLDDDDEFYPDFFAEIKKVADQKLDVGVVSSWVEFRMHDGTFIKNKEIDLSRYWDTPVGNMWALKKEIFTKDKIFFDSKTVFEDLDFSIRIPQQYRRFIIPQVLRIYYALTHKKGEASSTKFDRQADNISYFYEKNKSFYLNAGRKAMASLNFMAGKINCQAGRYKTGRSYLWDSFLDEKRFKYFVYFLFARVFPKVFVSHKLLILKHKWLK